MKRLLTTVLLAGSASLLAQTPPEQFEVVKGAPSEAMPATPLVFIAYSFVWVVVFLYVTTLWRKLGRVERELHELSSKPLAPRH